MSPFTDLSNGLEYEIPTIHPFFNSESIIYTGSPSFWVGIHSFTLQKKKREAYRPTKLTLRIAPSQATQDFFKIVYSTNQGPALPIFPTKSSNHQQLRVSRPNMTHSYVTSQSYLT